MARKDRQFWESATNNNRTFLMYYYRLVELAVNTYEWKNLPDTIDPRFLELSLFSDGMAIFFYDEILGYLCLQTMIGGQLSVYRIPNERTAYAVNGYQNRLNQNNSVIIFNNYLHMPSRLDVEQYAARLYEIERTIDVNVKAQKTPLVVLAPENVRLTMKNLYMDYSGNEPVIFGDKRLDIDAVKVLKTDAPFVAAELQMLKRQIWSEALTYLGIDNSSNEKRERLVSDEVGANFGAIQAERNARLNARKDAAKQINAMFGLNISVEFREELNTNVAREPEESVVQQIE